MISTTIEDFLKKADPQNVTEIFTWAIILIFLLSCYLSKKGKQESFIKNSPTLMTSIGILGTFVGIVIGLLHFNTTNINESIPLLLDGLKTAFTTSIVGLLSAILFNFINTTFLSNNKKTTDENIKKEITPKDIFTSLESQRVNTEKIHQALIGNEASSLIGHIKLLRFESLEQLKEVNTNISNFSNSYHQRSDEFEKNLFESLRDFADMMSKAA